MNYLLEINAFERWLETHYLPSSSQLLWYKLMYLGSRSQWSEWITVDNRRLMVILQMSSENTFLRCRDELINVGLIEYQKGKKGSPNKYKILSLVGEDATKNTSKNEVQMEVKTEVNPEVKTKVNPEVETEVNVADIKNKTKIKQNIKKKDTSVSKEKAPPAHCDERFIPPTVDQVREYCHERQNGIDPEYFVDYYTSEGWNGITDWKAKIRVWEHLDKQKQRESVYTNSKTSVSKSKPNKFHNFEQRQTDYNSLLEEYEFVSHYDDLS